MDLDLGSLAASFVVSSIGFVLFYFGKKMKRYIHLFVGVVLMVFPYFISNTWAMLAIASVILGGFWFGLKQGMFH